MTEHDELNAKDREIEVLRADLRAGQQREQGYREEIQQLNSDVAERDSLIEALHEDVADRDDRICALEAQRTFLGIAGGLAGAALLFRDDR